MRRWIDHEKHNSDQIEILNAATRESARPAIHEIFRYQDQLMLWCSKLRLEGWEQINIRIGKQYEVINQRTRNDDYMCSSNESYNLVNYMIREDGNWRKQSETLYGHCCMEGIHDC